MNVSKSKSKLWYFGLEQLESRYTLQLTEWNRRVFDSLKIKYEVVEGDEISASKDISVGQVLDGFGRSYYAMSQIQNFLRKVKQGEVKPDDILFFEDMFHPGFEALPYLFNQMSWRPKVFVRCLAQTIDPDDFVHSTGMASWMRNFEGLVNNFVDGVMIASHEMAAFMTSAGWKVPLIVTGLPFGKSEVQERGTYKEPGSNYETQQNWKARPLRVSFAARTDQEKQPEFFINLAKWWKANSHVPVEFSILSGKALSSNNEKTLEALKLAEVEGHIKIYQNLSKDQYYGMLQNTRVLFNCALQDWVSNTVSEADALGANVLYPAYRSFPEVFNSDHTRLYVPWNYMDAYHKLRRLLFKPHPRIGEISDNQDETIWVTVYAMFHWKIRETDSFIRERLIDPQKTEYRHRLSAGDHYYGVEAPFWNFGEVTDKQLASSYKKEYK
jgi:hypothetical protein